MDDWGSKREIEQVRIICTFFRKAKLFDFESSPIFQFFSLLQDVFVGKFLDVIQHICV